MSDFPDVFRIAQIIRLDAPGFSWNKKATIRAAIRKGEYFVAQEKRRIAGIICLSHESWVLEIDVLAVDSAWQGRGIGKALVRFAKKQAAERGCTTLIVGSYDGYRAKPFYLRCGFRVVAHVRCVPRFPYWTFRCSIKR